MLAITHFAVGATCGALIASLIKANPRDIPVMMVFSGLWAMVPDIGKPIPGISPDLLHNSTGNVFWFHSILDLMETTYASIEGSIALAVLVFTVVLIRKRS